MTELPAKLEAIIGPSIAELGYDLVQVKLLGQAGRQTLQVLAERTGGESVSLDDCVTISRAISALLDVEDPIQGAYSLEVSSPGVDRPLLKEADYVRYRGHEAKLLLSRPLEGQRRFRGVLGECSGGKVAVTLEDGREVQLELSVVENAKLVLTDALLKAMQPAPAE